MNGESRDNLLQWMGSESGNTVRSWLNILVSAMIPVVLAIVGYGFTQQQRATDIEIESNRQNEAALQAYLDDMTDLILDRDLRSSESGDVVQAVARSRTLTVLQSLDAARKGFVLQFLYESGLIRNPFMGNQDRVVVDLSGADFQDVNLNGATLTNANLANTNFSNATLKQVDLFNAVISRAKFINADLEQANLSQAFLQNTDFGGAKMEAALLGRIGVESYRVYCETQACKDDPYLTLSGAEIWRTNLSGVNLRNAHMKAVKISECIMIDADLSGAELIDANLSMIYGIKSLGKPILEGAYLPDKKLDAVNLSGADLTDAYIYDADFRGADLSGAILHNTILVDSDLRDAKLKGADLSGADLSRTDLTGAIVSVEQLNQAASLEGAIMPDGTIHD